jgi:hypothetical protein
VCFFRTVKVKDAPLRLACPGVLLVCFLAFASNAQSAEWQATVTKEPPGNFPPPRPLRAKYNFGWSGLTAATSDVHFTNLSGNRFLLEGIGRTTGLARLLWRFDVNYRAQADADTLRPIEMKQTETFRAKKVSTQLAFTSAGVTRSRTETPSASPPAKNREFKFPNLFDLNSAMLYLRSQPLKDRSVQRIVVYPEGSAYLATLTVLGREKISVRAGAYNAIKIDLQLSKVGKNLELEPHKKFRKATVWVSDDADRIILRIDAQIFVGTVFAELQSVRFDNPKP